MISFINTFAKLVLFILTVFLIAKGIDSLRYQEQEYDLIYIVPSNKPLTT